MTYLMGMEKFLPNSVIISVFLSSDKKKKTVMASTDQLFDIYSCLHSQNSQWYRFMCIHVYQNAQDDVLLIQKHVINIRPQQQREQILTFA